MIVRDCDNNGDRSYLQRDSVEDHEGFRMKECRSADPVVTERPIIFMRSASWMTGGKGIRMRGRIFAMWAISFRNSRIDNRQRSMKKNWIGTRSLYCKITNIFATLKLVIFGTQIPSENNDSGIESLSVVWLPSNQKRRK